jgi:hypothetical protein
MAKKLKGLNSLQALRDSLPPGPQKTVFEDVSMGCKVPDSECSLCVDQVGVVVPAPGVPSLRERLDNPEGRHLVMMAALGQSILHMDPPLPGTPPPPVQDKKIDSLHFDNLSRAIDESQVVGEFIEWMDRMGMLPVEFSSGFDFANNAKNRLKLQRWFFEEQDR